MSHNLYHRRLWSLDELSRHDVLALLAAASGLRRATQEGAPCKLLRGKNLALLCDEQVDERCEVFRQAAVELGAHVTRIRPSDSHLERRDTVQGTARMLGQLYDAIECDGIASVVVEEIERDAGIPVYNGLCNDAHPTTVLADLMTMQERSAKPLPELAVCYVGDPRSSHGDALLQTAALLGVDLRVVASSDAAPLPERLLRAQRAAQDSSAQLSFPKSQAEAMAGVDFVYDAAVAGHRPALSANHQAGAWGTEDQQRNQRFMLQALLISTIV